MALEAGAQLGPYRIQDPLGAGGMGEVYRALDPRLGRQVAVKILPAGFTSDPDRLQRFEQEARAAGALNHPNILAVHDFGMHDGSPYVVFELLEGETLRQRMGDSALPVRKSLDYASQIALGLAAAHERGIVHRDLKPENLFVTRDGRVKILDFGLAKLTGAETGGLHEAAPTRTVAPSTEPGKLMGTVGYMSPEQVRARPADHRSDIFTFGAILYEMLTGRRAFHGDSAVETMNSILKEDPPDFASTNRSLPPELERIVRHCLEKHPDERFQSARDLAFDIQAMSGASGSLTGPVAAAGGRWKRGRWVMPVLTGAALLVAVGVGFLVGRGGLARGREGGAAAGSQGRNAHEMPAYRRLTFRRGPVRNARFTPDGRSIVYVAAWGTEPNTTYTTLAGSAESRALGFPGADLFGISSRGELALSLNASPSVSFISTGTLARVPLTGEAPRAVLEGVAYADWSPDGEKLVIMREVAGRWRVEMPPDTVVYETAGWISHPRVSPGGDRIAFIQHPLRADDGGSLVVVEPGKPPQTLSLGWLSIMGLAWSPGGDEVWFSATKSGLARSLWAVDLSGRERALATAPGTLTLQDVGRDGSVLVTRENIRMAMAGLRRGETRERDLSWFDWSLARALSRDGETVLFDESGEGGGASYSAYVRRTDGSPAVRLGDGAGFDLSADGKWAILNKVSRDRRGISLAPTGTGSPRDLPTPGLEVHYAFFFPDGNRILLHANEKDGPVRAYVMTLSGGSPRPLALPSIDTRGAAISPDGTLVALLDAEKRWHLVPSDGGAARPLPGVDPGLFPICWSSDGRFIYARKRVAPSATIHRYEIASGRTEFVREIRPADGVSRTGASVITPDGKSYAYSYVEFTSDLYFVEGVR